MTPHIPLHLTLSGRPLLLYPPVAQELHQMLQSAHSQRTARLSDRLFRRGEKSTEIKPVAAATPQARVMLGEGPARPAATPYIELISIRGPLLNRAEYWGDMLCIDGYDRIEAALMGAVQDPACAGIMLDIDSPGGMVNQCFELVDVMADIAKEKPLASWTGGLACSAAYALASAASEITASLTAITGSIGVIYGRPDYTGWNDKNGFKINFITSGNKKTWGNPDTEMSDDEFAEEQAEINTLAGMFFERVARTRPLTPEQIQDLQAGSFLTGAAMSAGLVDHQGSLNDALARFSSRILDPDSVTEPEPAPAPAATEPNPPIQQSTPKQPKENSMSRLSLARSRASVAALLSGLAMGMTMNAMSDEEKDAIDEEDITAAVDDETADAVDAMEDDDVAAIDDEDTEALEDDEDVKAMDEDDMEDEDKSALASASRISHAALTKLRASSAKPAKTPSAAKSAKTNAGDRLAIAEQILALPEAAGKESHARTLAFNTDCTVEQAKAKLKADKSRSASRTAATPNPDLGPGGTKNAKANAFEDALNKSASDMRKRAGQA